VRGKQHRQPHEGSQRGKNLLSMAAAAGNIEAVDEVDREDQYGRTQLYVACGNGQVDAARQLLDRGADVERADKYGQTPLISACQNGHVDAARLLLDKGAEVDGAQKDGWTPLHFACMKGHADVVQLLHEKGAEVNQADKDGQTPLYIACQCGHVDTALMLLDKGADVNRASMTGTTPLGIAKILGKSSIVALLEEHLSKADDVVATAPPPAPPPRRSRGKDIVNMAMKAGEKKAREECDKEREEDKRARNALELENKALKAQLAAAKRNTLVTVPYAKLVEATRDFFDALGKGGFGEVYKGRMDEADIAVKVLSRENDRNAYESFRRELTFLAQLDHPNVVPLHAVSMDPGQPLCLVYPLYARGALGGALREALAPRKRLAIALDVSRGLAYLHAKGIVHRDIKPGNILLGAEGAVLADVGCARDLSLPPTSFSRGWAPGTRGFVCPVYQKTHKPTKAADIYSFGVVLEQLAKQADGGPAGSWLKIYFTKLAKRCKYSRGLDTTARPTASWLARELERKVGQVSGILA